MPRSIIGITISNELLTTLDKSRGLIPRSRFIEKIIRQNLGLDK